MTPGDGDSRHGTANGYGNLKCRCDSCRRAWADKCAEYRHRTGRNLPAEMWKRLNAPRIYPHGTESKYTHEKCRCKKCRAASAKARWRRRHVSLQASREYDREYARVRRVRLREEGNTP